MEVSKVFCFTFVFKSPILETFNKHLSDTCCVPHILLGTRRQKWIEQSNSNSSPNSYSLPAATMHGAFKEVVHTTTNSEWWFCAGNAGTAHWKHTKMRAWGRGNPLGSNRIARDRSWERIQGRMGPACAKDFHMEIWSEVQHTWNSELKDRESGGSRGSQDILRSLDLSWRHGDFKWGWGSLCNNKICISEKAVQPPGCGVWGDDWNQEKLEAGTPRGRVCTVTAEKGNVTSVAQFIHHPQYKGVCNRNMRIKCPDNIA